MSKMPKLPKSEYKKRGRVSTFERTMFRSLVGRAGYESLRHLYLARAGEWFVASQLLRRGLNAATTSVDSGVDILAYQELDLTEPLLQAEHIVYQFQVKTTAASEYRGAMAVKKVHELWHKVINLVVVFWRDRHAPDSIVIPPSLIRMLTSGGFDDPRAPLQLRDGLVMLRVISSRGRYFIRNRDNDLTSMLNRFDRIEPIDTDTCMFPPYASWGEGKGLVTLDASTEL